MSIYSIKYKGNEDISNIDMTKAYLTTGTFVVSVVLVLSVIF